MVGHIVRFTEVGRYDINQDCEVTRFVATTSKGSYHVEVPTGTSKDVRENMAKFKEKVMEALESNKDPCEVTLQ